MILPSDGECIDLVLNEELVNLRVYSCVAEVSFLVFFSCLLAFSQCLFDTVQVLPPETIILASDILQPLVDTGVVDVAQPIVDTGVVDVAQPIVDTGVVDVGNVIANVTNIVPFDITPILEQLINETIDYLWVVSDFNPHSVVKLLAQRILDYRMYYDVDQYPLFADKLKEFNISIVNDTETLLNAINSGEKDTPEVKTSLKKIEDKCQALFTAIF